MPIAQGHKRVIGTYSHKTYLVTSGFPFTQFLFSASLPPSRTLLLIFFVNTPPFIHLCVSFYFILSVSPSYTTPSHHLFFQLSLSWPKFRNKSWSINQIDVFTEFYKTQSKCKKQRGRTLHILLSYKDKCSYLLFMQPLVYFFYLLVTFDGKKTFLT